MNILITNYSVGDKLHCYLHSDYDFEMELEIEGITNFSLADSNENILRKLFNSEINYQTVKNNTTYFYVCKVLTATQNYRINDKIVLCDSLIKPTTYYLENSVRLILDLSYNTHSSVYRSPSDIVTDLKTYLTSKNVTNSVVMGKTSDELAEDELNNLRTFLNDVKGLKTIEPVLSDLMKIQSIDIYEKLNTQMLVLVSVANGLINSIKSI